MVLGALLTVSSLGSQPLRVFRRADLGIALLSLIQQFFAGERVAHDRGQFGPPFEERWC